MKFMKLLPSFSVLFLNLSLALFSAGPANAQQSGPQDQTDPGKLMERTWGYTDCKLAEEDNPRAAVALSRIPEPSEYADDENRHRFDWAIPKAFSYKVSWGPVFHCDGGLFISREVIGELKPELIIPKLSENERAAGDLYFQELYHFDFEEQIGSAGQWRLVDVKGKGSATRTKEVQDDSAPSGSRVSNYDTLTFNIERFRRGWIHSFELLLESWEHGHHELDTSENKLKAEPETCRNESWGDWYAIPKLNQLLSRDLLSAIPTLGFFSTRANYLWDTEFKDLPSGIGAFGKGQNKQVISCFATDPSGEKIPTSFSETVLDLGKTYTESEESSLKIKAEYEGRGAERILISNIGQYSKSFWRKNAFSPTAKEYFSWDYTGRPYPAKLGFPANTTAPNFIEIRNYSDVELDGNGNLVSPLLSKGDTLEVEWSTSSRSNDPSGYYRYAVRQQSYEPVAVRWDLRNTDESKKKMSFALKKDPFVDVAEKELREKTEELIKKARRLAQNRFMNTASTSLKPVYGRSVYGK